MSVKTHQGLSACFSTRLGLASRELLWGLYSLRAPQTLAWVKVIRPSCNPCAVNQDIKRQQFAAMSDYSGSPSDHHIDIQPPKRKANQAGLDGHATGRSVKRRASKACQCCRSRKVRCNVTEHGAPCTNCRLDEVECIVSESRRKKSVPHFHVISETSLSKHKQCFCLINDVAFCRHANSAEGSILA
jgi:hypothetical protein